MKHNIQNFHFVISYADFVIPFCSNLALYHYYKSIYTTNDLWFLARYCSNVSKKCAEPNEINNLKIVANFQPTNDMTGFFTFQVRAVDAGNNEAFSDAQVVIIATENQIFLTFNNPIGYVTQYDAEIKGVFDSVFPFNYTRDDISSTISESGSAAKIDQTIIRCHFLDSDSVPVLNSVVNG